jgi:hypothetical protein
MNAIRLKWQPYGCRCRRKILFPVQWRHESFSKESAGIMNRLPRPLQKKYREKLGVSGC